MYLVGFGLGFPFDIFAHLDGVLLETFMVMVGVFFADIM